ncbi:trypsin-like peptidase domain-containing protein [Botrimarina mediterranea]|uniref:trypsin-like peptidase domain-containing protein n=1 Tax=Botrimarina mediterranea TaxID=2528022 RepID=UPI0011892444|nr:hypothetical protein K2D_43570 [Planctomycetes bacterium K2D]
MNHALLLGWWLALVGAVGAQCGPYGCYGGYSAKPLAAGPPQVTGPRSHESIARIVHHEGGGASIGSGTLVASRNGNGYVLTCAHLFTSEGKTEVQLAGRSLAARIVAMDRVHDLVLLETQGVAGRAVETAEWTATGWLSACGFGSTGQLRCVRGPVLGFSTAAGASSPSVRIRGAVRQGDSGGPVLDASGRLVAVVWGASNGETFAMGGEPLRRILERLPKRELAPVRREPESEPEVATDSLRKELRAYAAQLEERLKRLESLPARPPVADAPGSPAPRLAPPVGGVGERVAGGLVTAAWVESLFAAVAVGGPLGLAAWAGLRWLRQSKRGAQADRCEPLKVAIDSPPPPQRVVPETHYVSYERDDYARAHQWASEQLARKFPGSVELLTSLDSLIRQQLNGKS